MKQTNQSVATYSDRMVFALHKLIMIKLMIYNSLHAQCTLLVNIINIE